MLAAKIFFVKPFLRAEFLSLLRDAMSRYLILICALSIGFLNAQSIATFEAASIAVGDPANRGTCGQYLSGGRFNVTNCPLLYIIESAYDLKEFQISDPPRWISEGKLSTYTIRAEAGTSAGKEQVRLMVQQLLADRFNLKLHRELKSTPVYALIIDKNGPRLHVADSDGSLRGSGGIGIRGAGWLEGTNVSLGHLAEVLSSRADRPVVDRTEFKDSIDFSLRWTPDTAQGENPGPSLFTAIREQLGLKLEAQTLPFEFVVIDHVDRPSAN